LLFWKIVELPGTLCLHFLKFDRINRIYRIIISQNLVNLVNPVEIPPKIKLLSESANIVREVLAGKMSKK
jgi:hypothetical protein